MKTIEELNKIREEARAKIRMRISQPAVRIIVGASTASIAAGAREVTKAAVDSVVELAVQDVDIVQDSKIDVTDACPVVVVEKEGKEPIRFSKVNAELMKKIVREHVASKTLVAD